MDPAPAIRVDGVSHAFTTPEGTPMMALDHVSFDVPRGQFLALVGASGCGKTTILNMAAGLIQPVAGSVMVNGERLLKPSRRTGYMFARDGLLPWRSARSNLEVGLELRGVPSEERARRGTALLDMIGLAAFANAYPWQLSQGMRQRVALARTLAIDPDTLLMDEPFAALDAQTKLMLQAEFLRVWERDRKTVLFVTHDLSEAVALADRVIVLTRRPGRIQADIAIDLPRPRDPERIRFDHAYLRLSEQVWQALKAGEAAQ
jgi:NitT/TauT family transport system ATP-binding protein